MTDNRTRKHSFKVRIIAGTLSLITVFSVGTMALTTSASAATLPKTGDRTTDTIINTGYQAGMGLVRQYVPGGQAIVGAIDAIIGGFTDDGPSLSDVRQDISNLRAEVSKGFSEVKKQITDSQNAIENKIVNQTVIANKGTDFDSLMTAMKNVERQLKVIEDNDKLTEQEKAVEIAFLMGNNADWLKKDNLYFGYCDFMNTLSSSTFADCKGRDLFRVIYDDYASKVMFSGEALDKADPYVQRVMYLGLYAYSLNAEMLMAHQTISKFTAEDEAKLNPDELIKYHAVKSLTGIVNSEINELNDKMFNTEREDSVVTHLNSFKSMSRTIFVNKNTVEKAFKPSLKRFVITGSLNGSSNYNKVSDICSNSISHTDLCTIWEYIMTNYKGMTWREYLTKVGFNMNEVSSNARLTFEGAANSHINYYIVGLEYEYWASGFLTDVRIEHSDHLVIPGPGCVNWKIGVNGQNFFKQESWNYAESRGSMYAAFDPA